MQEIIDAKTVQNLLDYDPETGLFYWKKRTNEMLPKPMQNGRLAAWNTKYSGKQCFNGITNKGYLSGSIFDTTLWSHRVAWACAHGEWPNIIDHIDGCRTNNKLLNLRNVTHLENGRNRKQSANNTSKQTGVFWIEKDKAWIVRVGKQYGGWFRDYDKAVAARLELASKYGMTIRNGG